MHAGLSSSAIDFNNDKGGLDLRLKRDGLNATGSDFRCKCGKLLNPSAQVDLSSGHRHSISGRLNHGVSLTHSSGMSSDYSANTYCRRKEIDIWSETSEEEQPQSKHVKE